MLSVVMAPVAEASAVGCTEHCVPPFVSMVLSVVSTILGVSGSEKPEAVTIVLHVSDSFGSGWSVPPGTVPGTAGGVPVRRSVYVKISVVWSSFSFHA